MTRHATELLNHVMRHLSIKSRNAAVRRQQAEAWLDQHCAGWRTSKKPASTRRVVRVSKEDEDEE